MNSARLLDRIPATLPEGQPVVMLNLLQWNETATYAEAATATATATATSLAPATGREAYMQRYIPVLTSIAAKYGGYTLLYIGRPASALVGPESDDKWDVVALVKYSDVQTFRRLLESDEYALTARAHRDAALKDWRLFVTTEMDV